MREVYIERHLEKEVKKASRFYSVVLVCGQRQVGKSTIKNFDVLNKFKMNVKKGSIICMSEEFIPYDRKADLCPVSSIL